MKNLPQITTTQDYAGVCRVCGAGSAFRVHIQYGNRETDNAYCSSHAPGAALDAWKPNGRDLVGR
ncbi:hypothetical protein MYP14_04680 [Rhodococcus pyridinivorans]|uniref:hypothetical protein n=1 Tax=Rhodococcus pyridinivorans TaxID=103816 RepID=UPI001FFF0480|nr:hypothetical protein [Rhodococcus pyridinivorans]UPK64662.1 hypothetical protein MYP14_04680 [Rhodococcus pyridinivorans]